MFKEEQKLESLARRLRESNDQLLDLLLDLNSSLVLPPESRFNVKYREDWADRDAIDMGSANKLLTEEYQLDQGSYSHPRFSQLKDSLEHHVAATQAQPLSELEARVPNLVYRNDAQFRRIADEFADPAAYLTYDNEEESLKRLDIQLGEPPSLPSVEKDPNAPLSLSNLTPREMDREVELRNPQSVHNWLKKHNINIGETDEKADLNGSAPSSKKGASRNLAKKIGDRALERAREREEGSPIGSVAGNKPEPDGPEDELSFDDFSDRRRKSRDADETYRPKGGRTGKPKRKREDGEPRAYNKKPKTSIGGMSDA